MGLAVRRRCFSPPRCNFKRKQVGGRTRLRHMLSMPARSRVLKDASQTDLMVEETMHYCTLVTVSGRHSWNEFGKCASLFHPSCSSGDLDAAYTAGLLLFAAQLDPVQEAGCARWTLLEMLMQGYSLVLPELGSHSAVSITTLHTLRACREPSVRREAVQQATTHACCVGALRALAATAEDPPSFRSKKQQALAGQAYIADAC